MSKSKDPGARGVGVGPVAIPHDPPPHPGVFIEQIFDQRPMAMAAMMGAVMAHDWTDELFAYPVDETRKLREEARKVIETGDEESVATAMEVLMTTPESPSERDFGFGSVADSEEADYLFAAHDAGLISVKTVAEKFGLSLIPDKEK